MSALWSCAIGDDDRWQTRWADPKHPVPAAIARMLAKGIDPADLTDVVRAMEVDVLFNVAQLLDGDSAGVADMQAKIAENVEWSGGSPSTTASRSA
jgi:hypothetical protein